jgi:hypothetical protein
MAVALVDVGVVWMPVTEPLVGMPMRVRHARRCPGVVLVPMVLVVLVPVFVLERLVHVFVIVALAHVEPDPNRHERRRQQQAGRDGIAEGDDSDGRADEGAVEK